MKQSLPAPNLLILLNIATYLVIFSDSTCVCSCMVVVVSSVNFVFRYINLPNISIFAKYLKVPKQLIYLGCKISP